MNNQEHKRGRNLRLFIVFSLVTAAIFAFVYIFAEVLNPAAQMLVILVLPMLFLVFFVVLVGDIHFKGGRDTVIIILTYVVVVTLIGSFLSIAGINAVPITAQEVLLLFSIFVPSLTILLHVIAFHFAYLVKHLFKPNSAIGHNWVKAIDYVYLSLSAFSILRIVVSTVTTGQGSLRFSSFAAVLLGFAVALRLTRTSIEIFEWDKAPENRRGATDDSERWWHPPKTR